VNPSSMRPHLAPHRCLFPFFKRRGRISDPCNGSSLRGDALRLTSAMEIRFPSYYGYPWASRLSDSPPDSRSGLWEFHGSIPFEGFLIRLCSLPCSPREPEPLFRTTY
jgi:hypothetical protein